MSAGSEKPIAASSFEVVIEKIVAGGDGLGRHRGRVVFVPGTAPGERHRVEPVVERKDYLRARSIELVEASVDRRQPPCPYYDRCGGCSLMHLTPRVQLEVKRDILVESLERATGSKLVTKVVTHGCEESGYRNRLRFHVAPEGESGEGRGPAMGFHRRESHDVVDIEHCLLGSEALNQSWRRLRQWAGASAGLAEPLTSIELSESSEEPGRVVGRFVVRSSDGLRRFDAGSCQELLSTTGLAGFVVEAPEARSRVVAGRPRVRHRVSGISFQQTAGSFFQPNRLLVEELVEAVLPEGTVERAVDLYSGVGLFTLPLAARAASVLGVEASPSAVRDARSNARRAGLEKVRFRQGEAARYARENGFRAFELVVVDPPRGGLPRPLTRALAESALERLCYVSCDPAALGRDVARLERAGFRLDSLALFDLFPNTHHFETVAWLSRDP